MTKNIIFDVGNVLIDYNPLGYIESLGFKGDDAVSLKRAIFDNKLWPEIDRGTYTFAEAIERLSSEYSEYVGEIKKILHPTWLEILKPKEDTVKIFKELKTKGYNIYILSNFSKEGFDFIESAYDFFKLADGKVVSAHVNYIKPEKEIYEILLQKYELSAAECLFVDDVEANISAGEALGIKGILFKNAQQLEEVLKNLYNI